MVAPYWPSYAHHYRNHHLSSGYEKKRREDINKRYLDFVQVPDSGDAREGGTSAICVD